MTLKPLPTVLAIVIVVLIADTPAWPGPRPELPDRAGLTERRRRRPAESGYRIVAGRLWSNPLPHRWVDFDKITVVQNANRPRIRPI